MLSKIHLYIKYFILCTRQFESKPFRLITLLVFETLNGRAINALYNFRCVSMAMNVKLISWQKDIKNTI